jgi:hypothetical protein
MWPEYRLGSGMPFNTNAVNVNPQKLNSQRNKEA